MTYSIGVWPMLLNLFDGEGAAAPAGTGAQGENNGVPAPTRPGKKAGAYDNVLFGKQPGAQGIVNSAAQTAPSGETGQTPVQKSQVQATSDTLEQRKAAFRQMIEGEYKDLYTQETQRMIDRRFRETKQLQQIVDDFQPVFDVLAQRYGESDPKKLAEKIGNDTAYWSEAADVAGMSVEQYKEFQRLRRENKALEEAQKRQQGQAQMDAQLQKWYQEAQTLKQKFPTFDLSAESQNPDFIRLLKSGNSMEHAYKVIHMDELMTDAMTTAAARTEQRVVADVRARGARPAEAGTAAQGGFTVKDDVTKLTKADRLEAIRRAKRGETIMF